jgi:hypothetical protein
MKKYLALLTSILVLGCLEGPAGSNGKDGVSGSGIQRDSVVFDYIAAYIYNGIHFDKSFQLSSEAKEVFKNIDTSMFRIDSVYFEEDPLGWEKMMFIKTPYDPSSWGGVTTFFGAYPNANPDSSKWFFMSSFGGFGPPVKYAQPYSMQGGFLEYYVGKGFAVNGNSGVWLRIYQPMDAKVRVFYSR